MQAISAALTVEKKDKGRKRHIVVDITGNLLAACVHAANIHDTKSVCLPAAKAYDKYPNIENSVVMKGIEEHLLSILAGILMGLT